MEIKLKQAEKETICQLLKIPFGAPKAELAGLNIFTSEKEYNEAVKYLGEILCSYLAEEREEEKNPNEIRFVLTEEGLKEFAKSETDW